MRKFWCFSVCIFLSLSLHAEIKYVFYFIGDGMGANHVLATEMYLAERQGKIGRNRLEMTGLPVTGMCSTYSASNGITDSAAAGTALATGSKTNNGTLGLNANGDTLVSIAEQLKAAGWGVGILTTVAIDHATPGAFYANVKSRNDYYEIGRQLTETGFDFFGGAGFHEPEGKGKKAPNLYDLAEKRGYTIASGMEDALAKGKTAEKMIFVQASDGVDRTAKGSNYPYILDAQPGDMNLPLLTEFAITFLERRAEKFFMMVEGGMIDYAGHGRDAACVINQTIYFDTAIRIATDFARRHPKETLIVVTADHETGGMALGNSHYTLQLDLLRHQKCSAWALSDALTAMYKDGKVPAWEEVKALLTEKLGFYTDVPVSDEDDAALQDAYRKTTEDADQSVKTLYKDINLLGSTAIGVLNKMAKIGWTSYSHTAAAVPLFADGPDANAVFSGWMDNTDVAPKILKLIEKQKGN